MAHGMAAFLLSGFIFVPSKTPVLQYSIIQAERSDDE
jgi:hypothetical protein